MTGDLTDTDRIDAIASGLCVRQEDTLSTNGEYTSEWFSSMGFGGWSRAPTIREAMDAAILAYRQGAN